MFKIKTMFGWWDCRKLSLCVCVSLHFWKLLFLFLQQTRNILTSKIKKWKTICRYVKRITLLWCFQAFHLWEGSQRSHWHNWINWTKGENSSDHPVQGTAITSGLGDKETWVIVSSIKTKQQQVPYSFQGTTCSMGAQDLIWLFNESRKLMILFLSGKEKDSL